MEVAKQIKANSELVKAEVEKATSNIVKAVDKEICQAKVHNGILKKYLLKDLAVENSGYKGGFGCDGRHFKGCKSGQKAN